MNLTLIKQKPQTESNCIVSISITAIIPNPSQPRRHFESQELTAMAKSISRIGIIQPLIVRETVDGYELISGERRLRAAKLAGLKFVPCIVNDVSDCSSAIIALVENLQRQDLNFFEQAEGFRLLIKKYGMTQQETAIQLGITQPTVANKLRLLKLSPEHRNTIINFGLTERHARTLLRVDESCRSEVLDVICDKHLSADAAERYVDALIKHEKLKDSYKKRSAVLTDVRLFFNTVEKALNVMRLAGVDAKSEKKQEEGYIEYVIKIPDKKA
jgi:ParB family chromosome partitioning protein